MRPWTAVFLTCAAAIAQDDLRVLRAPSEPAPREMVRAYLTGIANRQLAARRQSVAGIKTAADLDRRRDAIRKNFLRMIGGLPERTPLHLRTTGTLDRDGYRVEKLVYESQPKFYVTANLYVPTAGAPPYPAVLQPTGHSASAKNRAFYQSLALGLVKQGFVVLTYDPLGQGERRIFYDPELEDSRVGASTTVEHEMVGVQSLLAGESVARYMIWDGIRGIDVLSSLAYVDAKRIGVAGCSGGGTLTVYLAALDDRVAAAAPACYVTNWEEQLKGTGPQDAEQQFPGMFREGLNHADLVALAAPKPYLICSTADDYFPLEGARHTFEESKRVWSLLGAGDRIQWFSTAGGHGMPVPTREAIYGWMNRWLRGGPPGPSKEPPFETEHEETLNATETGQVSTSLGGETASTLNRRRFGALQPAGEGSLRDRVLRLTAYEKPEGTMRSESFGLIGREGYQIERILYWTAPERYVPALLFRPIQANGNAVVFADTRGKAAEAAPDRDADHLARMGYTVLSIDLEGNGETASTWGGYSNVWFGEEKVAWLGLMVGRPLIGLHMEDISRAIDLLEERKLAGGGVLGFGKGAAAVAMLHAAVADPRIARVIAEGALASYHSVVERPIHRFMHPVALPDVLRNYDLPGLAAAIAPRKVTIVSPRDPMGRELSMAAARKLYGAAASLAFRREPDTVDKLGF
jgi:dienelactone hydrolase